MIKFLSVMDGWTYGQTDTKYNIVVKMYTEILLSYDCKSNKPRSKIKLGFLLDPSISFQGFFHIESWKIGPFFT